MLKRELIDMLIKTADYFGARGFVDWEKEALESAVRIQNGDLSIIKGLWLKYSPTVGKPWGQFSFFNILTWEPLGTGRVL